MLNYDTKQIFHNISNIHNITNTKQHIHSVIAMYYVNIKTLKHNGLREHFTHQMQLIHFTIALITTT